MRTVRIRAKRRAGWAIGMTAPLPACSVFAEYPTRDIHVRSGLPATTTAWLIADLLRKEIPAGDDLPMHACPPLQRTGDVPAFAPRLTGQLAMDGYRMAPGVRPAR